MENRETSHAEAHGKNTNDSARLAVVVVVLVVTAAILLLIVELLRIIAKSRGMMMVLAMNSAFAWSMIFYIRRRNFTDCLYIKIIRTGTAMILSNYYSLYSLVELSRV